MIIERYEHPVDFTAPALSSPILQELDWILDDPKLFALFCHDLKQHYKTSRAGRRPIPAEGIISIIRGKPLAVARRHPVDAVRLAG
jgi:hypothetical protein